MKQIPCIDFTQGPHSLEQGSEGWKDLCNQVREACEQYGSFQVMYSKIPSKLCQDVFEECKPLFDLPQETKAKNTSSRPYFDGYLGNSDLDMYRNFEGFGIADSPMFEAVQAFADIMWPNGNPSFCEAVHSISKHFHELEMIVMKMLCDAYGVAKHFK
ncbi:2-oxoglutarate and iron-dependent oxygenase domain-containing protein, partial [Ralstonia pseudosolanacearum]|uniref:2-oxoglutarate and iron-dependent oxygenase domain-containing protein n=1 Tax=Ralstonia pseudosolanacearum TaxID=1310165 RepID=UPI003CF1DA9B